MSLPDCIHPGCIRAARHPNYVYCEYHSLATDDADSTRAKLSYLRQDAANALAAFIYLLSEEANGEQINIAALGYVSAQATYTLACGEAKNGEILPYVEIDEGLT